MKAWVLDRGRLEEREVAPEPLRAGWARLKVEAAGICGSDVQKILGPELPPWHTRILGHEFVGRIMQTVEGSEGLGRDDLVAAMPLISCKGCSACRSGRENLCAGFQAIGRTVPGAFAETVDVPVDNLFLLPSGAAPEPWVLTDPLAVCLHAIRESGVRTGSLSVAVVGDGSIGCLLAWLMYQSGHSVYLKAKHNQNAEFAERLGIRILNGDEGAEAFDLVFETVGRAQEASMVDCQRLVRPGGRITVLGAFAPKFSMAIVLRDLFIREITLQGVNAYRPIEFEEALHWVEVHQDSLARFISHRMPPYHLPAAIQAVAAKTSFAMKVVVGQGHYE
jgi:threonine dehydrogenase-like Zn-dependent dehydrogenase